MTSNVKLFAGSASKNLAADIAQAYGQPLAQATTTIFSDGEMNISIEESVRGSYVFFIQSTNAPADNIMQLLLLSDAAKRASADYITAVIPCFGYARQDRKDRSRVPISAKLVANLLTAAGINRIMTMDLHADQLEGFFDIPVDHLRSESIFMPYLQTQPELLSNTIFASPDTGSTKRARNYAQFFQTEFVICDKLRLKANEVASMTVIGEVKDKDVIIIDDLIDTAGTMCKAAEAIMAKGAKSVRAFCTHAVLSGKAYELIEASPLTELIVTDTLPLKKESHKIKVVSSAELFAKAIRNAHEHKSMAPLFMTKKS